MPIDACCSLVVFPKNQLETGAQMQLTVNRRCFGHKKTPHIDKLMLQSQEMYCVGCRIFIEVTVRPTFVLNG